MEKAHTGVRYDTFHRHARLGACGLERVAVGIISAANIHAKDELNVFAAIKGVNRALGICGGERAGAQANAHNQLGKHSPDGYDASRKSFLFVHILEFRQGLPVRCQQQVCCGYHKACMRLPR